MTHRKRIGIFAGATSLWLAFVASYAGWIRPAAGPAAPGSIPADVLARSEAARAHMRKLADALKAYAMSNRDRLPSDLRMLYPRYISDPRLFWHPGDADSQPTGISNNTPDQPDSTRISFEFTASPSLNLADDAPLVWDNTAANNGGLFATTLTLGGVFKTSPAFATPEPTRPAVAQHNLRQLVLGCLTYAAANQDQFPTDPAMLAPLGAAPGLFWNPGDSDPEPTAITNSVPNAINSARVSFAYLGGNPDTPGRNVLFADNSFANNGGTGILVGCTDGTASLFGKSTRCAAAALVAQARLKLIGTALLTYATDHAGHFPLKLSALYPGYISDPAVFWNPGDRDPCPTTISNDTPDAASSAQVSFRYLGADYNDSCSPQVVLALDGSLSNNGGAGIAVLAADGHVDCWGPAPLSCQHPPTCSAVAAANLRQFGAALATYAASNQEVFPTRLSMLFDVGIVSNPESFWNPGDSGPSPLTISNDLPNQPDSAQISFEYLGAGHGPDDDPNLVVMRDNTAANNGGRGLNVLYADGHTGYIASVTPAALTVTGPDTVHRAGSAQYTCTATYSDGTHWDITPYASWSVTSGPGAVGEQGLYAAPVSMPVGTTAILHVSYKEGGVTRQADKIIEVAACSDPFADADGDGDVDAADFAAFQRCLSPAGGAVAVDCRCFDRPLPPADYGDGAVDGDDFALFQLCVSGPGIPANPACDG